MNRERITKEEDPMFYFLANKSFWHLIKSFFLYLSNGRKFMDESTKERKTLDNDLLGTKICLHDKFILEIQNSEVQTD